MTREPDTLPAVVWTMRKNGDEHRFLVSGKCYVTSYPTQFGKTWHWVYTVLSASTAKLTEGFAVQEVERYEADGWTLEKAPVCSRDLVYRYWLEQQSLTAEKSEAFDQVFATIIKYGEPA